MKKQFLFFVFILLCTAVSAQEAVQDTLFLKNGDIICGKLVNLGPNKTVKIDTDRGQLLIPVADIGDAGVHTLKMNVTKRQIREYLAKNASTENTPVPEPLSESTESTVPIAKKQLFIIQAGIGDFFTPDVATSDNLAIGSYKLNVTYDFFLYHSIAVGATTGFKSILNETLVPLMIDLRYFNPGKKTLSSFALDAGYSYMFQTQYIAPSIDASYTFGYKVFKSFYLTIGADINIQFSPTNAYSQYESYGINLGVIF